MQSGKNWFYSHWQGNWYGFVAEKNWVWFNTVLILKKTPPPPNPMDGMLYRNMDGDLVLYYDSVPHRILTDKLLDSMLMEYFYGEPLKP